MLLAVPEALFSYNLTKNKKTQKLIVFYFTTSKNIKACQSEITSLITFLRPELKSISLFRGNR